MASVGNISSITLPNNNTYDLKDKNAITRTAEMQTTNPFAPESLKGPYISKIDNAFYAADKRFTVSGIIDGSSSISQSLLTKCFDGNYDNAYYVPSGKTATITIDCTGNSETGGNYFPGYPYGYILVSFYYNNVPASVSGRVYCNYEPHGIGWKNISFSLVTGTNSTNCVYRSIHQGFYQISKFEITVVANENNNAGITQIEMHLDRPHPGKNPFLSKYGPETLYYDLTVPNVNGKINNHTVDKDVPSSAVFTDTTYAVATTAANGLMSSGDKAKVNGLKALASKDNVSTTYKPAGTVSKPTFTGTSATISIPITAAGSVSKPNIDVTPTTVNVSKLSTGGTVPSLTMTVDNNQVLVFSWSAGSMPTFNNQAVVTGISAALHEAPTFTGSSVSGSTTYTPAGSVSQPTFTGTSATLISS